LFGSRLAGLGAALLTGFISIMPAFYVNWGRYTQLTGQILLVVALSLAAGIAGRSSDFRKANAHASRITYRVAHAARNLLRRDVLLTAMCVAGLAVVHYRVLIFFGLFLVALAVWQLVSLWGRWRELVLTWARLFCATAIGLLLALPWLIRLLTDYFPNLTQRLSSVTPEYLAAYNDPGAIRVFAGAALPALAFLGILGALAGLERGRRGRPDGRIQGPANGDPGSRGIEQGAMLDQNRTEVEADGDGPSAETTSAAGARSSPASTGLSPASPDGLALTLGVWTLFLIASLWIVPGAIGGYTVAITLYIPLAALGGFGLDRVARWALRRVRFGRHEQWLPALAVVLSAPVAAYFTGTWHLADPANYSYVGQADQQAFAWIREHTPPGSKFLISSEFSYAGRGLTATDAGMWIPLLAGGGRTVSIPASITGNEEPIDPRFFADTRKLAAWTQPVGEPGEAGDSLQVDLVTRGIIPYTAAITAEETLALMRALGCDYIYVGSQAGPSHQRLDVEALRHDEGHFTLLYFQDGVLIFEITR
jgi:hypothetical protein